MGVKNEYGSPVCITKDFLLFASYELPSCIQADLKSILESCLLTVANVRTPSLAMVFVFLQTLGIIFTSAMRRTVVIKW